MTAQTPRFNKRLLLLAADVFDLAAERIPDNVCGDFETPSDLTNDELQHIADLLDLSNMGGACESLEEWRADNPDDATTVDDICEQMTSWVLAGAMAHMVRKMAEAMPDA